MAPFFFQKKKSFLSGENFVETKEEVTWNATSDWLNNPFLPQSPMTNRLSDPSGLGERSNSCRSAEQGTNAGAIVTAARTTTVKAALWSAANAIARTDESFQARTGRAAVDGIKWKRRNKDYRRSRREKNRTYWEAHWLSGFTLDLNAPRDPNLPWFAVRSWNQVLEQVKQERRDRVLLIFFCPIVLEMWIFLEYLGHN